MTPAALSLARRVRELLAEPGRWTQGAYARDAAGAPVLAVSSASAACWCLHGAIHRASSPDANYDGDAISELCVALDGNVSRDVFGGYIVWNDHPRRTHADVLALLDRVIEDGER